MKSYALLCLVLLATSGCVEESGTLATVVPLAHTNRAIVRCLDTEAYCIQQMYEACGRINFPTPVVDQKGSNQNYYSDGRVFVSPYAGGGRTSSQTVSRYWAVFHCSK